MRGVLNIVLGGVFVFGGLSGRMVLIGTDSGEALAVLGLGLVGLGIYRLTKRPQESNTP